MGWGRWGLREVAVIAIRHPAYLALTDGECVVPHRGVTACNDIRGTMKPGTHFLSILFGHWLVPMLHPSFPLSCIGISPSTLTGDRVLLCYAISKSNAFTNTSTFKQAIMDIAAAKTQRRTVQKSVHGRKKKTNYRMLLQKWSTECGHWQSDCIWKNYIKMLFFVLVVKEIGVYLKVYLLYHTSPKILYNLLAGVHIYVCM